MPKIGQGGTNSQTDKPHPKNGDRTRPVFRVMQERNVVVYIDQCPSFIDDENVSHVVCCQVICLRDFSAALVEHPVARYVGPDSDRPRRHYLADRAMPIDVASVGATNITVRDYA